MPNGGRMRRHRQIVLSMNGQGRRGWLTAGMTSRGHGDIRSLRGRRIGLWPHLYPQHQPRSPHHQFTLRVRPRLRLLPRRCQVRRSLCRVCTQRYQRLVQKVHLNPFPQLLQVLGLTTSSTLRAIATSTVWGYTVPMGRLGLTSLITRSYGVTMRFLHVIRPPRLRRYGWLRGSMLNCRCLTKNWRWSMLMKCTGGSSAPHDG